MCTEKGPANKSNAPINTMKAPMSSSKLERENAEGGESKDVSCVVAADDQHRKMPKSRIKNPKKDT
jgi:hypothetical protein